MNKTGSHMDGGATPKIIAGTQATDMNLTGGTSRFRITSMD